MVQNTGNETKGELVIKRSVTLPQNTDRDRGGFQIIYLAGYGTTAASVPQAIRTAVTLWAVAIYEDRIVDPEMPPPEAEKILAQYKLYEI
jgi:hypothetical protein